MELRHLRYFVTVAELGNVSRAAEKLFIAQPPLSTQIKQLEAEIGVALLVRGPRGVSLTPAGTRFMAEAKDLLERAERTRRFAQRTSDPLGGLVRIGFVPSASHTVLSRLLRSMRATQPLAEMTVQEMVTSDQVNALRAGDIDVGIARPSVTAMQRIVIAAEIDDPFCLAVPEGHALAKQGSLDLTSASGEAFVFFTRQMGPAYFDQIIGLCTDAGFSPNIRYQASTLYGVLDLVDAGLGVAIVPASAALLGRKRLRIRPLVDPTRRCSMALLHRKNPPDALVPLLPLLLDSASTIFKQLADDVSSALRAGAGQRKPSEKNKAAASKRGAKTSRQSSP